MTILLVIATVLTASARNQTVKKTLRIEGFNAIRCEFVADIYYTQGKSYSVEAQASEKIMNMVSIHKKGNTLSLPKRKVTRKVTRTKRDCNSTSQHQKSMICKYRCGRFPCQRNGCRRLSLNVKGVSRFECENLTCKSFRFFHPGSEQKPCHDPCTNGTLRLQRSRQIHTPYLCGQLASAKQRRKQSNSGF